jgi:SREBP regulating gene protein
MIESLRGQVFQRSAHPKAPTPPRSGVASRYACTQPRRCHAEDQCCSSYEHCVSCCLKPGHRAAELAREQFRIHGHAGTGHWGSAFQYCEGKCRTHKRCTQHENAYIDGRHFCFSDSARPKARFPPTSLCGCS